VKRMLILYMLLAATALAQSPSNPGTEIVSSNYVVNRDGDSTGFIVNSGADTIWVTADSIYSAQGDTAWSSPFGPSIDAAEMTDADHGDVAWSGGTASVQDLSISGQTQGDVLYFNGSNWLRLALGSAGQVLHVNTGEDGVEWNTDDGAGAATIENDVYGSGWNGDITNGASQNALYDYLHQLDSDDDGNIGDEATTILADWVNTAYPWDTNEIVEADPYVDSLLSQAVNGGTETGIAVSFDPADTTYDFVVAEDIRNHTLDTSEVLDVLRDSISGDVTIGAGGTATVQDGSHEHTWADIADVNPEVSAGEVRLLAGVTDTIQNQIDSELATTGTAADVDTSGTQIAAGFAANNALYDNFSELAGTVDSNDIGADHVNDLDINFGSGTDQVDGNDINSASDASIVTEAEAAATYATLANTFDTATVVDTAQGLLASYFDSATVVDTAQALDAITIAAYYDTAGTVDTCQALIAVER